MRESLLLPAYPTLVLDQMDLRVHGVGTSLKEAELERHRLAVEIAHIRRDRDRPVHTVRPIKTKLQCTGITLEGMQCQNYVVHSYSNEYALCYNHRKQLNPNGWYRRTCTHMRCSRIVALKGRDNAMRANTPSPMCKLCTWRLKRKAEGKAAWWSPFHSSPEAKVIPSDLTDFFAEHMPNYTGLPSPTSPT